MGLPKTISALMMLLLCISCQSRYGSEAVFGNALALQQILITEETDYPAFGDEALSIYRNINCRIFGREYAKVRYEIIVQWGGPFRKKIRTQFLDETEDILVPTQALINVLEKRFSCSKQDSEAKKTSKNKMTRLHVSYANMTKGFADKTYKNCLRSDIDNLWREFKQIKGNGEL